MPKAPPFTVPPETRAPMAKPELGMKRVCVACGAKFFDLMKVPAVCPKCATEQPAEQPRPRRGGNPVEEKRVKKPVVADEADADVLGVGYISSDRERGRRDHRKSGFILFFIFYLLSARPEGRAQRAPPLGHPVLSTNLPYSL